MIDIDLGARGTPETPTVGGTLSIRSLRAHLPPLGIEITRADLAARVQDQDDLTFEGRLCTAGCVTVGGAMERPLQPDWRLDARLDGRRIALSDTPELRAIVTPELELAGDRAGWRLAGLLAVDEAALVASTLPRTAVRPAPETIVHDGAAGSARRRGRGAPLALDIRAQLGDVRFEGFGLEAQLGGTLDLARTAGGRPLVEGTAEIEHGTFRVQWQEFDIERGRLIFTGQPENPSLDIRATRDGEEGQVGLDIAGTANHPVSEVFTDVPMSESEALTQLVTGRSSPDGGTEYNALERLARNIGLQHASQALGRLRTGIGLDELGMDRSGNGNRALVAGERIGNDLLLCYRHGLFDDFTGLELIYGISDRFRLHTKSGSGQSIDLVYEVGPVDAPRPGCRGRGARVR